MALCALGTGVARVTMETCASALLGTLRFHLQLGGSRLTRVIIVLTDEARLRVFHDVALDVLRVMHESAADVGLASSETPVEPEGATRIGESSGSRSATRRDEAS